MRDDSALLRAAQAKWLLVPAVAGADDQLSSNKVDEAAASDRCSEQHELAYLRIALPVGSMDMGNEDLLVGRDPGCKLPLDSPWVSHCPL